MSSASSSPIVAPCATPAIIGPVYEPKGRFWELNGIKIYQTGSASATKALFVLYDIFGFSYQIIQGADFLASQGYKVFMPDFWEGRPAPMRWMPMPDVFGREQPADSKALLEFCNGPGNTEKTVAKVRQLQSMLQGMNPEISRWGLVGACWGGFIANFLLDAHSPFLACVELQPGFPGREIAVGVSRPILAICSRDEPEKESAHFAPYLQTEYQFVHFPDMLHGFMSARGDLFRKEVQIQFQRGYEMAAAWFARYL